MPGIARETNLDVTIGGGNVANAFAARVSLGYDMSYGTASVDIAGDWPGGNFEDQVDIVVNGEHWYSGVLTEVSYKYYPKAVTAICRGPMWYLDMSRFESDPTATNPTAEKGLFLEDFVGGPASDEAIVQAVIDRVGVSTNGGSIGGTGRINGSIAPEEWAWRDGESALAYIQRIDQISLGYRTFESTGGSIFRSQVSVLPGGGADMSFQEGVDIVEAGNSRSIIDAFHAVRVSGYAVGDFLEPRVFTAGSGTRLYSVDSPMIERRAESSTGDGISCEALATYWLNELDRVFVKLSMTTPRNDNIGPGQVHNVQAGSRLQHSGDLWVQRVDKEYQPSGAIRQTMQYVGAG